MPRLVELGRRFRRETNYARHLGENTGQFAKLASDLIAHGWVLVSERGGEVIGMIGYVLFRHFMSGEMVAGEVFWWVEPEYRGEGIKLMRAVENRARESGAGRMQMIAPTDRVAGVYRRCGYEFVEASYQRAL